MKKFLMLALILMIGCSGDVYANERVPLYLFYGDGCNFCEAERAYLESIKNEYDFLDIYEFQVFGNQENSEKMNEIKEIYNITSPGVPFTVVGDTAILGFNDGMKQRIVFLINKYREEDFNDRTGKYLGLVQDDDIVIDKTEEVVQSSDLITSDYIENENDRGISASTILIISLILLVGALGVVTYISRKN